MEILKDLRSVIDLGVAALVLVGGFVLVYRPPAWVRIAVNAHHQLAEGVRTLSDSVASMPKREEVQELLIGQESLRRSNLAVQTEVREFTSAVQSELRALRAEMADGRRG